MVARQPWGVLAPALERAGLDVEQSIAHLRRYALALIEWNRNVSNIMSSNDEQRIVERHLLESLAPASWLIESGHSRWLDFGSGAGFPAIPLGIAGVEGRWTLVESRRTKTLFLMRMIQDYSLSGFEARHDRLETISADPAWAGAFDGFTSRATLRLGPTLELAAPIVRPGGSAFLWKGSGGDKEIAAAAHWKKSWELAGILGVGNGLNSVARFIRNTVC